jgi:NAD(P)-dependent dehydrogenase (short-subunit alcohol dehydrogenase family)
VISSVAGDRGRQSNYVYGSAKSAVTAFTSGLRQRLAKHGVKVVTIKPGFVDTPARHAADGGRPDHRSAAIRRRCPASRSESATMVNVGLA